MSDLSISLRMWNLESPESLGPSPVWKKTLVAITTSSLTSLSRMPRISSDLPRE